MQADPRRVGLRGSGDASLEQGKRIVVEFHPVDRTQDHRLPRATQHDALGQQRVFAGPGRGDETQADGLAKPRRDVDNKSRHPQWRGGGRKPHSAGTQHRPKQCHQDPQTSCFADRSVHRSPSDAASRPRLHWTGSIPDG